MPAKTRVRSSAPEVCRTELHLHSSYSFREGTSRPEELVERAAALGYAALAITDRDGLHGAMAFALACVEAGIQPITGVELTLRHGLVDTGSGPVHLTLLAETLQGYANLCRLITEAHRASVGMRPSPPPTTRPKGRGSSSSPDASPGADQPGSDATGSASASRKLVVQAMVPRAGKMPALPGTGTAFCGFPQPAAHSADDLASSSGADSAGVGDIVGEGTGVAGLDPPLGVRPHPIPLPPGRGDFRCSLDRCTGWLQPAAHLEEGVRSPLSLHSPESDHRGINAGSASASGGLPAQDRITGAGETPALPGTGSCNLAQPVTQSEGSSVRPSSGETSSEGAAVEEGAGAVGLDLPPGPRPHPIPLPPRRGDPSPPNSSPEAAQLASCTRVQSNRSTPNRARLISLSPPTLGERGPGSERATPALDPAFFEGHCAGLIVLSGDREGEVPRLVEQGRFDEALQAAARLAELFGPRNTFIELQHNLVYGDTRRVAALAELAARLGLGIVATGDVYYSERERHRLHDALVAVRHRTTLDASHRLRHPNSEFYLRAPKETAARFAEYPEALANTQRIAERCRAFNLAERGQLGYEFPEFVRTSDELGSTAESVLAAYCWSRFEERYPTDGTKPDLYEKARLQLAEELRLVEKHGLAGFFLIYRDIQELATEVAREVRGAGSVRNSSGLPPGRGRGSSVSSIICYLIGLSHVDPVKNRLFFKRFLNEDLQTVPDIDLDFARDIREQLILRMYERYGHDHVALVCSFATYHLRSAVRDLGKVLGLPAAAIDKLARLSEGGKASTVRMELDRLPEFQGQAEGPLWALLVDLAEQLDGLPRHVSQHPGGMIVSSKPLIEMVPVQPAAMEGRFICQWDKDSCDDARFIKIDFLALGMLSLVEECLELIWQNRGRRVDLSRIRYDEQAIYDAIGKGDTVGIFQIESRAQIQMLPRTRPRSLDDLAIQVALVRPGPIVGGAVNPYVHRRELLRRNPTYQPRADHPLIDEPLRDTLGIVLYQDQVLEVAIRIGGFTAGQADQFRRAMSRRRSQAAMERFREQFLDGARANGVPPATAEQIFAKLLAFSEFGFPKSHAYAFAVLAYQSAWLRRHFPAEYYAALFNSQPMGFYPPHVLVGDAKRHGLSIMRVTLNASSARCSVSGGQIRLGFTSVQGVGVEIAAAILAEREANGLYRSLPDLLRRTRLPYGAVKNLISVGALGEFGLSRRELLWQLGLLRPHLTPGPFPSGKGSAYPPAPSLRGKGSDMDLIGSDGSRLTAHDSQLTTHHLASEDYALRPMPYPLRPTPYALPKQLTLALPTEQDMVQLPDMSDWERMVTDYDLLQLSPSFHPLALLRKRLPDGILSAAALRRTRDGAFIRTAGLVVCRQRPQTAKGFLFLLLEDETGMANVVIRPDLYEEQRSILRGEPYLCVEGRVQLRSGSLNILATRVRLMTEILTSHPRESENAEPVTTPDAASTPLTVVPIGSHNFR
jgi:error-prone DNA polymerase